MKNLNSVIAQALRPISRSIKTCPVHGLEFEETVYKNHRTVCPQCRQEREAAAREAEEAKRKAEQEKALRAEIQERIGRTGIPKRFADKTVAGYRADTEAQRYIIERVKAYAREFAEPGGHSGRNLALLGNAGTGKTHLACALARHVVRNCGGYARFTSVAEINRMVREAKSYNSTHSESEIISAFASCDLLVIDEVGVQSGTEAESRALFDVFNERYQNCKPTVLISNLDPEGLREALGERIADRIKEDGGEILLFDWESYRT